MPDDEGGLSRRGFLKILGTLPLAAAVDSAKLRLPDPPNEMQKEEKSLSEITKSLEVQKVFRDVDRAIGEDKWKSALSRLYGNMNDDFAIARFRPWKMYEEIMSEISGRLLAGDRKGAINSWETYISPGVTGEWLTPKQYLEIGSARNQRGNLRQIAEGGEIEAGHRDTINRLMFEGSIPEDLLFIFHYPRNPQDKHKLVGPDAAATYVSDQCGYGQECSDVIAFEATLLPKQRERQVLIHESMHYWNHETNRSMIGELTPTQLAGASYMLASALADEARGRRYPWDLKYLLVDSLAWETRGNKSDVYPNFLWLMRRSLSGEQMNLFQAPVPQIDEGRLVLPPIETISELFNANGWLIEALRQDELWRMVLAEIGDLSAAGLGSELATRGLAGGFIPEGLKPADYINSLRGLGQVVLAKMMFEGRLDEALSKRYSFMGIPNMSQIFMARLFRICDGEKAATELEYQYSPALRDRRWSAELREVLLENPFIRYFKFIVESTGTKFALPPKQ